MHKQAFEHIATDFNEQPLKPVTKIRNAIAVLGVADATLDAVAKKVGMTTDEVKDTLDDETDYSGFDMFLTDIRLVRASRHLSWGDTVENAALASGFADAEDLRQSFVNLRPVTLEEFQNLLAFQDKADEALSYADPGV